MPIMITYGVAVRMHQFPDTFGDCVNKRPLSADIGVSKNCRLCNGGDFFDSRHLAEQFLEALIPIFNKRYGENSFSLAISERTGPQDEVKIKRCSDIVRWRLENSNFNPKSTVSE